MGGAYSSLVSEGTVSSAEIVVDAAGGVLAEVVGPHPGVRLAHRTKCVLHSSRSDGPTAGGKSSVAISLSIDLENWEWILECAEEWSDGVVAAEGIPEVPVVIQGVGSFSSDAGSDCLLNKAIITAESICLLGWQRRQEFLCGK